MKWGAERASRNLPAAKSVHPTCRRCVAEALEPRRLFASSFGSLDDTFGVLGHAIDPTTAASYEPNLEQIVVGSNGDIYAGGNNGVARFTAAGVPDSAYGTGGLAIYPSGTATKEVQAVDSDGRLYALTTTNNETELFRFTAGGMIDNTWGNDGVLKITSDASFTPAAIAVQPDNKLIIAGSGGGALVVFRVNADGSPDTTFATGGEFQDSFENQPVPGLVGPSQYGFSLVAGCSIMANGDILVGGGSYAQDPDFTDYSQAWFAAVRLTPAGVLDSTYGTHGISYQIFVDSWPDVSNVGFLVPTVFAANSAGVAIVVAPQYGEGLFGASGSATNVDEYIPGGGNAAGAAVLPDGQDILLEGTSLTPVNSDGTLDTTTVVDPYDPGEPPYISPPQSIAIASNGDLIAPGTPASGSGFELSAFFVGSGSPPSPKELASATINALTSAPDGSVYLAYHNTASNDLQFVDRLSNGQWGNPITVDASAGAGDFVSIATDPVSGSLIEIAYFDASAGSLKLATSTNTGASFTTQTIDAAGSVGESPSIYINHLDLASIAFYNQTTHHLQFAAQTLNRQWHISTIDARRDVGRDAVMAASPSGSLSVAYSDDARGWLKLATQKSNGTWQIDKAAVAPGGVEGIALGYGGTDTAAIAFYDIARHKLRVAEMTDSSSVSFSTTTVAADVGESTEICLAFNSGETPILFAFDATDDNVLEFQWDDYRDFWVRQFDPTATLVAGGGKYLSLTDDGGVEMAAYLESTTGGLTVSRIATVS